MRLLTSEQWGVNQDGDEQRKARYQRLTSFLHSLRSAKLLAFYEAEDLKGPWQCSDLAWAQHLGPLLTQDLPSIAELPKLVRGAFGDNFERPQDNILQEVRSTILLSRLQTLLAVQAEYGWMQALLSHTALSKLQSTSFPSGGSKNGSCAGMPHSICYSAMDLAVFFVIAPLVSPNEPATSSS